MNKRFLQWLLFIALPWASWTTGAAEPLRVVATIKPLQLLAIAVGSDTVIADALLKPNVSPHDYQLRPSDRRLLDGADLVVWIGPRLEVFLQSLVGSLPARTRVIALQDAGDAHLWLDPVAMGDAAQRLALALAELRPAQAGEFHRNADRIQQRLLDEDRVLRQQLAAAGKLRGFMVEHDAYRRFEQRYGLQHQAALTDSADLPPTPAQLAHIEQLLSSGAIGCVWREQQETRAMNRLLSGRTVNVESIDALALAQPLSEEGLVQFYRQLGRSVTKCLRLQKVEK